MSLFRFIEAYSYNVPRSSTFAIGKLCTGDREQIVIGGEDGLITVIDPTISSQSSKESFLAQHQADDPVVQVAIGNFLQYPDPVVAVLHTTSLAHYTLRYDERDPANTSFQLAFTHDIGEPAHCMCVVDDEHPQILVETVSCRLHLFQGDQCLFSRASLPALFPGPIAYHRTTSSLNIACGYHIYSVKFSLLSSLSNSGKKISFDWSFNCGDWPLQLFAVDNQVLIVARRNIFCLPATEPDRIRWQVRLESIAMYAHAYKCDESEHVRFLVATASNTLLVFKDNQLLWNCQMDFSPVTFCRSSLNPSSQHMLALLSVDGRFAVGYLGTEPHLFKPSHGNRVRDFKGMVDEMRELEKSIGGGPALPLTGVIAKNLSLSFEIESDKYETLSRGEMPRIPVRVVAQGVPVGSTVELSVHTPFTHTIRKGAGESIGLELRIGTKVPWTSIVDVVAVASSQAICVSKFRLPLNSILAEATPDRNSDLKLTLELDRHTIPLNELFTEFHTENPSSIGFQPYGPCDSTVSIFTANKTNRYRIQSDKMELLVLVSRELVERLRAREANIGLNSRLPLEYLQARVEKQIEVEQSFKKISAELERSSLELRAIQALVVSKTHNTKHANMDNVDLLYKTSHGKILEMIEAAIAKRNIKEELENELCAVFDLIALIGEFSMQATLVDGHFYGNTQQTLLERLSWATRKTDLLEALEALCHHTSKALPQITEEEQEEADYEPPQLFGVAI